MTASSAWPDLLPRGRLEVVAGAWRRMRRNLETSFTGTSMLPAISPGQVVIVECGVEAGVGDVALFLFESRVGVHRVAARTAEWVLTWGDANPLPDEPVAPDDLIGRVRSIPARQDSVGRALLLRLLLLARPDRRAITWRVRLCYRCRAWMQLGGLVGLGGVLSRMTAKRSQP